MSGKRGRSGPQDAAGERIKVLLPMPLEAALDYRAAPPAPGPGAIVRVPLGPRHPVGAVWDTDSLFAQGSGIPAEKLRPVEAILDLPPMRPAMRRFVDWVAGYTLAPAGAVLRMALPPRIAAARAPERTLCRLGETMPERMTETRRRVLGVLADGRAATPAEIAAEAKVSDGVVRALVRQGALKTESVTGDPPFPSPDPARPGPSLSPEQARAARALRDAVKTREFATILLEGVTGSGKTEVYFEAVSAALSLPDPAQVLVLLPEIALTSQWLERFETRFGARPVEWHSDLTDAERRRAWHRVADGSVRVVVGARSALFLPFAKLALIIVDEEHDPSYKQEEGVIYHARDMSVVRAWIEDIPVILSSATPSLETQANVARGRYRRVLLADRHGEAELPEILAVDLRRTPPAPGDWIAPPLAGAIGQALEKGEQALLFLNRRGYAPLTLCRTCGARLECPNCTAWLVEHRTGGSLQCHHCGFRIPVPDRCPSCGAVESLVACGPGVERLAEEVRRRWPAARTAVMASDTVAGPADARALVARIETGGIDIVIGTQIIAKGYHFPRLAVVGVVDADLGLRGGDLRAGERTWQQMMQVAGRAGRAAVAGRVFLQTWDPAHPVTAALIAGDGRAFLKREAEERRRAGMPPYGRLAAIILSSRDQTAVMEAGRKLARNVPQIAGVSVIGPAPAPLARLRREHRHRFLVKAPRNVDLQACLRRWTDGVDLPPSVRLRIDIDPLSFL